MTSTPITRQCLYCGRQFSASSAEEVYCSTECDRNHRRELADEQLGRARAADQTLDRLLAGSHVAQYLHVPLAQLEQMAAEGAIPARRVGGRWLFSAAAVNQWLRGPSSSGSDVSLQERINEIEQRLAAIQEQLRWLADAVAVAIRPTEPVGGIRNSDAGIMFDLKRLPDLALLEESYIQHVLDSCVGNKSRAAEILGIDPSTLYRKLAK